MPCGRADKSTHTLRSPGEIPKRNKEELLMKARIRLHKLLSVLLCCIMLVGMLPTHAYAWDTESECDFCHEFIADDWICDGGNHCSESSGHTSCYEENHCQVCGGCRDDDWCDDCHMHIDCARDEGLHCSNCGACFYDVTPCPRCNLPIFPRRSPLTEARKFILTR